MRWMTFRTIGGSGGIDQYPGYPRGLAEAGRGVRGKWKDVEPTLCQAEEGPKFSLFNKFAMCALE
jgi:hypothetical protein